MAKFEIRLNVKALEKEQQMRDLSDTELAALLGVSLTQIWRAKLPVEDSRRNSPGSSFVAGVLNAFDGSFEEYFTLGKVVRGRIAASEINTDTA